MQLTSVNLSRQTDRQTDRHVVFLPARIDLCAWNWRSPRTDRQTDRQTDRRVVFLPARIDLCAWNWWSPTTRVTSLKAARSNNRPSSSLSRQLGTLTGVTLDWPVTLTVSPTTLTCAMYTKHHHLPADTSISTFNPRHSFIRDAIYPVVLSLPLPVNSSPWA